VKYKDKYLNEEHKILYVFDALTMHLRLTELTLSNCGLSDDSVDLLLFKLLQYTNNIWHIDLS
jgi:hypothetical protein